MRDDRTQRYNSPISRRVSVLKALAKQTAFRTCAACVNACRMLMSNLVCRSNISQQLDMMRPLWGAGVLVCAIRSWSLLRVSVARAFARYFAAATSVHWLHARLSERRHACKLRIVSYGRAVVPTLSTSGASRNFERGRGDDIVVYRKCTQRTIGYTVKDVLLKKNLEANRERPLSTLPFESATVIGQCILKKVIALRIAQPASLYIPPNA